MPNDPILTLHLPRSVALAALNALRKLPLEQVEVPHGLLLQQVQLADERMLMEGLMAKLNPAPPPAEDLPGA